MTSRNQIGGVLDICESANEQSLAAKLIALSMMCLVFSDGRVLT